jgi:FtsZ-binding cell division protein ZapB
MKKKAHDEQQTTLAGMDEAEILGRLSERVEKAVSTIQELRKERDQLRARITELESRAQEQESLEEEQGRLRAERGEIRTRIENILSSLESLDDE